MQNHTMVPCTRVMVVGLRSVRLRFPTLEVDEILDDPITYRQLWTRLSTIAMEECLKRVRRIESGAAC